MAVARPMPWLPPLITTTLSVKRTPLRFYPVYLKRRCGTAWRKRARPADGSQIQHQPRRVFQALLHAHQEGHGFLAVDDTVIVGKRQIHHRPNLDLAADRHRTFLDLVHAEDTGLRRVEDRRRHQRTVDAAIGDGERAALHLVDLELAVAGAPAKIGNAFFDFRNRLVIAVAHHRNDEALVGADGDADVVII